MDLFLTIWDAMLDASSGDEGEAALDRVMQILLATDDVKDPSITYERSTGRVEIEVVVDAADPLDCFQKSSGIIRAAAHGAGLATPGWPTAADGLAGRMALHFEQGPRLEPVG
jgi:hypothetical protein